MARANSIGGRPLNDDGGGQGPARADGHRRRHLRRLVAAGDEQKLEQPEVPSLGILTIILSSRLMPIWMRHHGCIAASEWFGSITRKEQKLNTVIFEVRACFHRLKAFADAMHRDLGISASMRGVLEALAERPEQTVPQIARTKGVSRQHIQVNVDGLSAGGWVRLRRNPGHTRSPLIVLTERGRAAFTEMRRRESAAPEELAAGQAERNLDAALLALQALRQSPVLAKEKADGNSR